MAQRSLRFRDLALTTVAMTLSIRWLAVAAAAGPAAAPLWVLAALGFMAPLAIATAELTTRFEGEGGVYVWTREVLGPFAGFLCGWLYWTCNLPFFSGLLYFIVNVLGEAAGGATQAALANPTVYLAAVVALALLVGLANLLGLGAGKQLSNFGATASLALFLLLIAAGAEIALVRGPATDFAHAAWRPPLDAGGAILWSTMVFALGGPEALALLRNEVEGGIGQILRVLAVAGSLLALLYVLGTFGVLSILPAAETSRLSGVPDALRASLTRIGLPAAAPWALGLLALALLGNYAAWFTVAARLPFAVGADRYLPAAFGRRDARTGAPTVSIIVQTLATIALALLGRAGTNLRAAYDFLVSMTVLSYTLPFVFLFIAYLKVQSAPRPPGSWSPPGGAPSARWIGAIGLTVTLSAVACTLAPSPDASAPEWAVAKLVLGAGLLILAGAASYAFGRRRAQVLAVEAHG